MITAKRLRELMSYNPTTGLFIRTHSHRRPDRVGISLGGAVNAGYVRLHIAGRLYLAHRVAWIYVHGRWPGAIDHINGIRNDNRLVNLRCASPELNSQNRRVASRNNTTGLLGVSRHQGGYQAKIQVNRKTAYLGSYPTAKLAHAAYLKAKRERHDGCTI